MASDGVNVVNELVRVEGDEDEIDMDVPRQLIVLCTSLYVFTSKLRTNSVVLKHVAALKISNETDRCTP